MDFSTPAGISWRWPFRGGKRGPFGVYPYQGEVQNRSKGLFPLGKACWKGIREKIPGGNVFLTWKASMVCIFNTCVTVDPILGQNGNLEGLEWRPRTCPMGKPWMSDRLQIPMKRLSTPQSEANCPRSRGAACFLPLSPLWPRLDHRNEVTNYPKRPTQKIDQIWTRPHNHLENDFLKWHGVVKVEIQGVIPVSMRKGGRFKLVKKWHFWHLFSNFSLKMDRYTWVTITTIKWKDMSILELPWHGIYHLSLKSYRVPKLEHFAHVMIYPIPKG